VVFSADGGRLLAVFDWARAAPAEPVPDAYVWDAATGRAVLALKGELVKHAEFSPDGRRVLLRLEDNSLRVHDATSGAAITPPLKGPAGAQGSVAFSGDGKWVVALDRGGSGSGGEVRVWDAARGRPAGAAVREPDRPIFHAALSPDGRRLLTVSARE